MNPFKYKFVEDLIIQYLNDDKDILNLYLTNKLD
jgi:hypothetical protein